MSDDWFQHQGEDVPQTEHASHVSARVLGVTFLVITFGVVFVVLVLVAYFNSYNDDVLAEKREGIEFVADEYLEYRRQARETLARTEWVNRDAGTVRVPIDLGKRSVVDMYNSDDRAGLPAWNGAPSVTPEPDPSADTAELAATD